MIYFRCPRYFSGPVIICFLLAGICCNISGCKKRNNESAPGNYAPKNYTLKMGGMRTWNGTYLSVRHTSYYPVDSTFYLVDDTFPLIIINDSTIAIGATNYYSAREYLILHFISANDSAKTILFFNVLASSHPPDYVATDSFFVWYNYSNNSLIYKESGRVQDSFQNYTVDVNLKTP